MKHSFRERKAHRKEYYEKYIEGWKSRRCIACNGSGYYDHNGSPPCDGCDGTGREKYKPDENKRNQYFSIHAYLREWNYKIPEGFIAVFATLGGENIRKGIWVLVPEKAYKYGMEIDQSKYQWIRPLR